jgi:replicative DNA helicase
MQALEKPLPYNADAEKILLGAIILDNEQMGTVAETLVPDDFYIPQFRAMYGAMLDLYAKSQPITPLEVFERLKTQGIEKPMSEIANLVAGIPHFKNLENYISVVKEKSVARQFIRACNGAIAEAMGEGDAIHHLIDEVEQKMFNLREVGAVDRPVPLGEIAFHSVNESLERAKDGVSILGLQTGFTSVDNLTGGLQNTDLIIVAARPSMGKSAFSLDIAKGVTDKNPSSVVAYFSLEMSKRQCADRLICSLAKVSSSRYRLGMLTREEWARVSHAMDTLTHRKIFIDDKSSSSVFDIKSKARRIKAEQKRLDLIIVDYLQLMRGIDRGNSRQEEVSDISRDLKALAKDLNVPVIALSQLSRACEARQDKRPLLSDLRESGAIEQDADIVAFLYRDEYYNQPTPETAGVAELIFRKHRHGATDTIHLAFFKEFAQFGNRGYGEN